MKDYDKRIPDLQIFMLKKSQWDWVIRRQWGWVMAQVNCHPDKHERMKAIVERYVNGNLKALDPFPDGSEH